MSKKVFTLIAVLVMAAMILSACGAPATQSPAPAETQPPAAEATEPPAEATEPPAEATKPPAEVTEPPAGETIRACQVTDAGGIDDRSFNATAWLGVQRAMEELGIDGQYLESQQQTDYERNISQFIEADCDLIITVGFLLDAATAAAADANPDQNFAIVDFAYDPPRDNVLGLVYATHQAGFLAGYLAAGMTQTGAIGTFGGLQIPSVTTFMDGYALGAQYYNEVHGTDVRVLGWDPVAQTGLFAGNFESTDDGRTLGTTLMDEGADVIMPVAGPVGLGTAAAVQERGEGYYIVGVDSDWTVSSPEYADIILTSVIKRMDNSVYDAIQQVIDGTFAGGIYLGTLENEGVGLGTIHANVPAELIAEVEALIPEIIAGNIQTDPTAQ
jgi:basic membrane protein A